MKDTCYWVSNTWPWPISRLKWNTGRVSNIFNLFKVLDDKDFHGWISVKMSLDQLAVFQEKNRNHRWTQPDVYLSKSPVLEPIWSWLLSWSWSWVLSWSWVFWKHFSKATLIFCYLHSNSQSLSQLECIICWINGIVQK